jgi:RNA polymerase primary sigma factor
MQRNHREPNLEEVAAEMGVTEKLAEEIYHAYTSAVSLDHVASNHEYEFSQTIGELIPSAIDVPQEVETSETRSILQKAIGKLPKTQQTILIRRYGLDGSTPVTLDRLGLEMNLSGEAIRRHEKIAKATLKRTLNISMSS